IVAPAGNQNSPTPQYPAAFHRSHKNVIGVGSITRSKRRSSFSNYGPWVTCCTQGENVLSSFITHWQGQTEDGDPDGSSPLKTFTSGWARWSGTSFASPKVAAAIANRVAAGASPYKAWLAVARGRPTGQGMGKILSGLPPTP